MRPPPRNKLFGEILFFEDPAVVEFVACGQVGDGADTEFGVVRYAASRPGWFVQIAIERQRGAADGDVILDQVSDRAMREGAVLYVVVLLKTGQRGAIAAGDTEGAIGKNSLAVADVAEHFFQGPFIGGVAEVAIFVVTPAEENQHLAALGFERADDIAGGNKGDVALMIRGIFAGFGTGDVGGDQDRLGHRLAPFYPRIKRMDPGCIY